MECPALLEQSCRVNHEPPVVLNSIPRLEEDRIAYIFQDVEWKKFWICKHNPGVCVNLFNDEVMVLVTIVL